VGITDDRASVVTAQISSDHTHDPRSNEIAISLLARKWTVPVLVELLAEPRRRQYLFNRLRVSSSRLDPTIQVLSRWGLIARVWLPSGGTESPALAITDLGRCFLDAVSRLSEWQRSNDANLATNDAEWRARHSGPA
jgi:DNA-binding HxlR family transcriptional regulator